MNGFRFSEHIARAPREVFAVIGDPRQATAFLDTITDSVKLTDGPIGVGTTFRETRVVRGRESSADLLVVTYSPDTRVGISAAAEGITVTYDYQLAPEGAGTRLEWSCTLEASGLRTMMLPVVAAIMKREDGDHLRRLKGFLETPAPSAD